MPGTVPRTLRISLSAALLVSGCGARLMTLPVGPAAPASDIGVVVDEATRTCRTVSTYSAELTVRGSIGGRRIPRVRLLVGLMEPDFAYLDAVASFGESLFIYGASGSQATLLLPRDDRALEHGDPQAVLEAVTGIPLGAADLRTTVTGCMGADYAAGARLGEEWRRAAVGASSFYLRRRDSSEPWQLVAAVHETADRPAWRAEYRDFSRGLPTEIRLISRDPRRFDLRLTLSAIDVNQPLDASVFALAVPPSMTPISLEELRRSGPLATDFDGR